MIRALAALVVLTTGVALADEPPETPPKLDAKKLKAPKATPELIEHGRELFTTNCVACHGEKGDGKGIAGVALSPPPRDFTKDKFKQGTKPEELFVTISEGVATTPMVGWPQLSVDDRWALAHYVLTFVPQKGKAAKAQKPAAAEPHP